MMDYWPELNPEFVFNKNVKGKVDKYLSQCQSIVESYSTNFCEKSPDLLEGGSTDTLFYQIEDYTTYSDKEELCCALAKGPRREQVKTYREVEICYERLHPKLVQLYFTSPQRFYKWEKRNGVEVIVQKDGKQIKKGFDVHTKFFDALDFGKGKIPRAFHDGSGKV